VLGRIHRRVAQTEGLMDQIAEAVKGLPPEQQEAVAKRMIDESFK